MDEILTPELVLQGYAIGIFPMADEDGEIRWFSPDPRGIFEFDRFRIPRSLRPVLNKRKFEIRVNTAFADVMRACADRPEGTWISDEIVQLYTALHMAGFAHSVEAWREDQLVGGLYGVTLGAAYFGESMFHRETDASKVALVALIDCLRERDYALIDIQFATPHLERFGALDISRDEYMEQLGKAIALPRSFTDESPVSRV